MKRAVRKWLLRSLLRFPRRARPGEILALTYHSIDDSGSAISFPEQNFRRQVEWLASSGYQSLTASEAAAALVRGTEPAPRGVVLTFDDGFRSVLDTALPALSEVGFNATVFCAAGYVGGRCGWDRAPDIPAVEMMSWGDLGLLLGEGWEIGGHTVSHAHLPGLASDGIREEIAAGRRMLEDRLARQVTSFAYPYGEFDERCVAIAAETGLASAWTMTPIINAPGSGLFTLGRFNCDRIRSEDAEAAELALRTYVSGRYNVYALVTARRVRIRRRRREGR